MENMLEEQDEEAMERQILLTALELLADRGLIDGMEKNSAKVKLSGWTGAGEVG